MVDGEEFARWREEAGRALEAARASASRGLHNWACFGAEQAAQLALKALLHGIGTGPWGHDLDRLAQMATEAGLDLPASVADALRRLGRHYIPARYPDAHAGGAPGGHYAESDWLDAERDAVTAIAFVDDAWRRLG